MGIRCRGRAPAAPQSRPQLMSSDQVSPSSSSFQCSASSDSVYLHTMMRIGRNEYIDVNPRPTVPYCNCFPLYIGRLKITVFHFLFSCTMIFSILWGYLIYCAVVAAVYGERTIVAQDSEENVNSAMVDANY